MSISNFYRYNGLLMTFQYILRRRLKKITSWIIARKLTCGKIPRFEPIPFIRGLSFIKIGDYFTAGYRFRLEVTEDIRQWPFKVEIGDNVIVNDDVHIGCANRIIIGNNVLIASKVYITDHNHGYYDDVHRNYHESPEVPPRKRSLTSDGFVEIGDNVWIGEFVAILPGSKIGRGAIIGSNSVVKGDVPAYTIAVGSPARVIKKYDFGKKEWLKV